MEEGVGDGRLGREEKEEEAKSNRWVVLVDSGYGGLQELREQLSVCARGVGRVNSKLRDRSNYLPPLAIVMTTSSNRDHFFQTT